MSKFNNRSSSKRVLDPIRQCYVTLTPEEIVRQSLLRRMLVELGYPKGLIAVEKELGEHRRRFDIVCYGLHFHPKHELHPLLIVECKAKDCGKAAKEQALGYNATLNAPFLCIASMTKIETLWLNSDKIDSVPFLPPYLKLLEMAQQRFKDANH